MDFLNIETENRMVAAKAWEKGVVNWYLMNIEKMKGFWK
jgi:hypothetical protein